MFNPKHFENSRPDGFGVLEVVPPEPSAPRLFVPLQRTELTGEVAGPLADLRLVQTFGYSAAQCDKTLEAVYRFPLPGDAAVTGVTVRFGAVTIEATLKERQRAEQEYQEAKAQGRQAALASRESPDVFTLQVAGIQPDQEVVVETHYVQLARAEGSGWTLRIPLTTSPRYVREDERGSRHAQGQPLALLRDPGHRFALDLRLQNAANVVSKTHALAVREEEGEGLRVRLENGETLPDRDCVLTWRAAQQEQHPALHILLHDDTATGQVYFLALVAPPAARGALPGAPRESVLLVDHSGSMQGAKWEAADWAVKRFLGDLTPSDAFALGLFHDAPQWFVRKPLPADPKAVAEAVTFLEKHKDSGGTNLGVALEQALGLERAEGERSRHLLIVTDAEVSDAGRILRLATEESEREDRRRISVLCIDAAPNAFLAQELAERGGGIARFLTSAPEEEDITTALDTLLEDWSAPLLTGLRLEVGRPGGETTGRKTLRSQKSGYSAIDLGDLPAGRAVWVAGRVERGDLPDLAFRVTTADGREIAACRRDLLADTHRPALKALFGARRVLGLETLIHAHYTPLERAEQLRALGYDAEAIKKAKSALPNKLYAENVREEAEHWLRDLLVRESLDYGIACAETAFVAVRTEAGKPIEGTVAVANALPSGWSPEFLTGGGAATLMASIAVAAPSPQMPGARAQARYRAAPAAGDYMFTEMEDAGASGANPPTLLSKMVGAVSQLLTGKLDSLDEPKSKAQKGKPLFSGAPVFTKGEAILFDSAQNDGGMPGAATLSSLQVDFPDGAPDAATLDPDLTLLLYVDDLAAPRARVRLTDLLRQGGSRPLNVQRRPGQVVQLVLSDPSGVWAQHPPRLEVRLVW